MPDQRAQAPPEPVTRIDRFELLGGDVPLRPLGVSEILDAAITGIRVAPRAILGFALIISTVITVITTTLRFFVIGDRSNTESTPRVVLSLLGAQGLLLSISALLTAYGVLLLAGIVAPVFGRVLFTLPVSFRRAWRDTRGGFGRLVVTAGLVLLMSVCAAAVCVLPLILVTVAEGPEGLALSAGIAGVPLGLVLVVWLYVRSVLAAPAIVIEHATIREALRRSARLMRHRWWRVCGTLLLALVITFFAGLILRPPLAILALWIFGDDPSGVSRVLATALTMFGQILASTLTIPFDAGVIALLYIDLRMRREGVDLEVQTRPDTEIAGGLTGNGSFLELWRPPGPGGPW